MGVSIHYAARAPAQARAITSRPQGCQGGADSCAIAGRTAVPPDAIARCINVRRAATSATPIGGQCHAHHHGGVNMPRRTGQPGDRRRMHGGTRVKQAGDLRGRAARWISRYSSELPPSVSASTDQAIAR